MLRNPPPITMGKRAMDSTYLEDGFLDHIWQGALAHARDHRPSFGDAMRQRCGELHECERTSV